MEPTTAAEGNVGIALFGSVIEKSMLSNIEGPADTNVQGMLYCSRIQITAKLKIQSLINSYPHMFAYGGSAP
jgi:hypothetical protein